MEELSTQKFNGEKLASEKINLQLFSIFCMKKALCNNPSDQQGKGMPGTRLDAALGNNLRLQVARMLCTQMMQHHPAIVCHVDGEHRGFSPLPEVVLGRKGLPKSKLGQSSVAAGMESGHRLKMAE